VTKCDRYWESILFQNRVISFTDEPLTDCNKTDLLWPPYAIGQAIIFFPLWFVLLSIFFSSPNLSRYRLDVCHTSTHGVALVRI